MSEIPVRHDELAISIQELRYFSEFPRLQVSYIFKNTLSYDNVESVLVKSDWSFNEVSFNQIW